MSVIILLILAICAFVLAFTPRWRAKYTWGRGSDRCAASRSGCLLAAAALATMAAGLGAQALRLVPEPFGVVGVMAGFITLMAAGLMDQWRQRR